MLPLIRLVAASLVGLLSVPSLTMAELTPRELKLAIDLLKKEPFKAYMRSDECEKVSYPGWERFSHQVERCIYLGYDDKRKNTIRLPVLMHVPDRDRAARWLVSACKYAGLGDGDKLGICIKALHHHIQGTSGYQFAITGLVDESYDAGVGCADEICYFTFRDGIAVRIPGLGAEEKSEPAGRVLLKRIRRVFDIKTEQSLALDSKVYCDPGKYARIASATLEDIISWQHENNAPELRTIKLTERENFPRVIRLLYQKALGSDSNALIDAWAINNCNRLADLASCKRAKQ